MIRLAIRTKSKNHKGFHPTDPSAGTPSQILTLIWVKRHAYIRSIFDEADRKINRKSRLPGDFRQILRASGVYGYREIQDRF